MARAPAGGTRGASICTGTGGEPDRDAQRGKRREYADRLGNLGIEPEGVEGGWYVPSEQGYEARIKAWLEALRG